MSEVKFHVNGKGEPGKCSAQEGNCPFGGSDDHYPSEEAAREGYEKNYQAFQTLRRAELEEKSTTPEPVKTLKPKRRKSKSTPPSLDYDEPILKTHHEVGSREYFDKLKRDPKIKEKVAARGNEIIQEAHEEYEKLSKTEEGREELEKREREARRRLSRNHEQVFFHGARGTIHYINGRGVVQSSVNNPYIPKDRTFYTKNDATAHRDVWRKELELNGLSRKEANNKLGEWGAGKL